MVDSVVEMPYCRPRKDMIRQVGVRAFPEGPSYIVGSEITARVPEVSQFYCRPQRERLAGIGVFDGNLVGRATEMSVNKYR